MQELATSLTGELGRGFSPRNLEYMRKFYLTFRDRETQSPQTVSAHLPVPSGDQNQVSLEADAKTQAPTAFFALSQESD